ncbi:acetolactate decarboxylase [Aliifodinibius sp. S!AR15-10]|uniref:acetolactate decarboxylase n=1 Tax=Aliifodinibius sp. S!AR15-10 TaxID=2950437 RepID=UPI00285E6B5B|nr:acetolactate decarboxylase [Aliifodinibius sp. S!AR15-10]MDR8394361.1 acetolactate decarboxylase [Aliifodinibius sp. S!AR15-10]
MLTRWSSVIVTTVMLLGCNQNQQMEQEQRPSGPHPYSNYMYQYSVIDALLAGVYDGDLSTAELQKKGDFGIGTFNRVDGELIMDGGRIYQARSDGTIQEVSEAQQLPFAQAVYFQADTSFFISTEDLEYSGLQEHLLSEFSENQVLAARLTGHFKTVYYRAPQAAEKPYIPLAEYLEKHQAEFNIENTTGKAIGFYLPRYLDRVNVPGFHFHYLSDDKQTGGHILGFTSESLQVEIDQIPGIIVEPMASEAFHKADLQKNREEEVKQVEQGYN